MFNILDMFDVNFYLKILFMVFEMEEKNSL